MKRQIRGEVYTSPKLQAALSMYMCVGRLSTGVGYVRTEALSIDESEEPTPSSDRSQGSQLDTPIGEGHGSFPVENNQRQLNQIKIKVRAKI